MMTDSSMLKYQYDTILDQLILLQLHAESPDCPCSLQGTQPGELGEFCEPKHLRSIVALARETIAMEEDRARLDYLENLVLEGSELLVKMELKLCDKEVDLGDYVTWSREKRKPLEEFCYSGFCSIAPKEGALVEEVALMFRKKAAPRWCHPVKETDKELSKLSRTLGTAKKRVAVIQKSLEIPLNICRGQAEMFESTTGVLDPYGSRCRDPETGLWVHSEECGYEPAGITTTALGMDGITRYEFEFKIVDVDRLVVSHDPFTFTPNPDYPAELQPRIRERAATKIQVEKIASNLEPDAVITDFHVIDRGTPIVGPDLVVEAGNGRVMGIARAVADYPEKYANYKQSLAARAHDFGLSSKDVESMEKPVLVRLRITDVDRNTFAQEANQAATIAPSAIENARTDAQKITMGMLQALVVGENESLEDALRAPKNQAFAKRFLATLPENVQAALVDAQGYLNRDGVHRMAMAVFVSAFQGDSGLRLAEKAFESVDMDVRNTVSAIARSLGPLSQAEALTRTGERDATLSIGDDLAQTVNVYSAIKRNPALTVEKYLAQEQIFARELTPFQEGILVVLEEYKRSPRKLAGIFTAYAEGVIAAPPPAQAALFPGAEITKEGLWESAVKAPEPQPALMEVAKMFDVADGSYEWLASKIDVCNLTSQQTFIALTWRPLRNFVAWGVGQGKTVRLCQTGMVDDAFQLSIGDLDMQQVAMATKMAQAIPTAKRVYTPYREVVYEIIVPSHIGIEDLTWTPQAVEKIRGERGKQPALFMEVTKMFEDTCERPSAKYQHLSTFFTKSATEAALFASEGGSTERKIDTVLAQLQSGIESIHESSNFKEFVDTMAKFHNYSLGNIMLITLQRPDAARVAGYTTWQGLGRNVIKGEHGIMILAPCFPPKPKKEKEEEDEEEPEERPVYFKVVHVFDISQTHGKELPAVEVPVITGDETRHLYQKAETYVAKLGITLDSQPRPDLEPDLMGFWSKPNNLIWLRPEAPQDQRTKTLLHETAHSQCSMRGARDAEVMAESVAYTVASHFGFDTGVRSFPYVAVWAGDVKVLKANLEVIRKVAKDMIEGMELVGGFSENVLIPTVEIEITRAEGPASETGTRQILAKNHPDLWGYANQLLMQWSKTAPKEGGYDKCDFKVTWEDGETYEGRYDLKHHTIESPNLAKHVWSFLVFNAGMGKPSHLTMQQYQDYLKRAAIPPEKYHEFLTTYEIGHYNAIDHPVIQGTLLSEVASMFAPMMLLTKEIRDKLPALYSQEEVEDPMVWVKFFTPDANWTWYATEFDGKDTFFGWVVGFEKELGYFSLSELESARGPMGLAIERDRWFKPMPLSEVEKLHQHEHGELGNERTSAGFPLNPTEEKTEDIDRFYKWTDTAGSAELLSELYERADYLGAHLCIAKEGDNVDKEWLEHCPYIGSMDVYDALSRLRFLFYKVTDKLPSSAVILRESQRCLELEGVVNQFIRYCNQWQRAHGEFEAGDGRFLILKNAKRAISTPEGAELGQGTMGAIGSAVITGIGIGTGFKIIEAIAKTFRKKRQPEGGEESEEGGDEPEEGGGGPLVSEEEQKEIEAVEEALKNAEVI